jgi:NADPH:quinone reductase-like Zn-dependent oxidoreductase
MHTSFGNPSEVLTLAESPMPQPGPGEVRIRMRLAAIHNHDLLTVAGTYGYKPDLPAIGGSEAMGTIDALGDGVQGLKQGQRVAVSGVRGAWADYFCAPAASVVPLPEAISDETAAQMLAMPLSALVLLEFLGAKPGQWVIQNAATGAVAKVLAMIARARGIHVVNIVRRPESVAELHALGIGNVVSAAAAGWQDEVRKLIGASSISFAVDGVGGQAAGELMALCGEGSTLISFGGMSGQPLQISAGDLIFKQVVVKGFWLARIMRTTAREEIGRWIGELVRLVAEGKVTLQVGGIFDLADIAKAVEASAASGRPGKILVRG